MNDSKNNRGTNQKTPPSHILIFKHAEPETDGEKVIKSVRKLLGSRQTYHPVLKNSVKYFSRQKRGLQDERIYPQLGMAAVHLEAEHVRKFKKHKEVLDVVENHTRHVQGHVNRILTAAEVRASHAASGVRNSIFPFGGGNDPVTPFGGGNDLLTAYGSGNDPLTPYGGGNDPLTPYGNDPLTPYASGSGLFRTPIGAYLLAKRDEAQNILRRIGTGKTPFGKRIVRSKNSSWCLEMVGIDDRYRKATGKGIKVAVLDTGIDLTHPDFKERVKKRNCLNLIDQSSSVQDRYGHGTHCCGIVAGKSKPECKIRYGVAPDVTLLVGKVMDDQGQGNDSDVLDGIAWAAQQKARVISLSLGSSRGLDEESSPAYSMAARRLLKLNCIIVAAAGNMSRRPFFLAPVANPAACPWILSVGAVGPDCRIAQFSCAQVDQIGLVNLSAPGIGVLSSYIGGTYAYLSGTSMAAAHIAGIAALYLELNPDWDSEFLWPMLIRCGVPLGASGDFGYGLGYAPQSGRA